MISRLLYNLNLPCEFINQVNFLRKLLPEANIEYGAEYFESILPLSENFLEKICNSNILGPTWFFYYAFQGNKFCWFL